METDNPIVFDDISKRKKWSYVSKNTLKAIKDQSLNNNYWNMLNHLP